MRVRRAPIAVLMASTALAGACAGAAPGQSATATPHPGPNTRVDATAANQACEGCHADAAATWRTSLHARAWVDPVFQRSFAEEPSPFCRNCHAPETASPAIGVACVTCHDPAATGEILAAPARARRTQPPHRVIRDAAFADERACASCHDFAFPDGPRRGNDGARMQRTIAEHRASRFADRTCASCHMPKVANGGRGHAFAVASDPRIISRALVARASRHEEHVEVDLAPGEVGHAFPTGDLFRRLVVVAEVVGVDYQLIAHAERALARHFRFEAGRDGAKIQREISDDRVQGSQRVELDLGALARGREIAWRVEWQRVQSMHGDDAVVADTIVVVAGRLPPGSEEDDK